MRVVHLLEHTSGWEDIHFRDWAHNDPRPATLKEGLDFNPSSRRSRWRPGTRHSYSNVGPAVAAYIIEKITGKRYEDYVAETFFAPLGMVTASFFLTPETDERLTRLYREDGQTEYPYFHFIVRPSGSLNISAREIGELLVFLLNRGSRGDTRILPAAALDRMETPMTTLGAQAGLKVGYGLQNLGVMHRDGFVWHGHSGGLDGTRSDLLYLPDAGVGYFCALNAYSDGALLAIGRLLRAYVTRDLKEPDLPPVAKVGAEAARYEGWYEIAGSRLDVYQFLLRIGLMTRVRASEDGLLVDSLLGKIRGDYLAVSPGLYRLPEDPAASLALLPPGPDGPMIEASKVPFKAIPTWMAWTQIVVTALALVLMASVPLFALVWIPRRLLGRMKGVKHFAARIGPLAAVSAFAGVVVLFMFVDSDADLGARTAWTGGITVCTVLFALFSFASLFTICRVPRREMNLGAYLHTLLTSVALAVVTIYLLYWGIIGYRPWA